MEARYYITISPDEELHTYTRQAEDGATVSRLLKGDAEP